MAMTHLPYPGRGHDVRGWLAVALTRVPQLA
jgi:hypothetical protein